MSVRRCVFAAFLGLVILTCPLTRAQQVSSISFDSVPADTMVVADPIVLDGPTEVTGALSSDSTVESRSGGFVFPDGSVQTSAGTGSGLYSNRIPDMTPPLPYSEVCFRDGSMMVDVHTVVEPTAGGSCQPGDIGWIIEREERTAAGVSWTEARADCLEDGMRLPEVFEYQLSCMNDTAFGLSAMQDDFEWASNFPFGVNLGTWASACALAFGGSGCGGSTLVVGDFNGTVAEEAYRCAR